MLQDPTFWVLIAFLIFFAAVGKQAFAAVTTGLDARTSQIKQDLDEAQRLREEAQSTLAKYQRKQRQAIGEAEAIVAQAREETEHLKAEAVAQLEEALQRRQQQALQRIAQAEAAALQDVRNLAVDMALAATRAVLADQVKGRKADQLIAAATQELPDKLH